MDVSTNRAKFTCAWLRSVQDCLHKLHVTSCVIIIILVPCLRRAACTRCIMYGVCRVWNADSADTGGLLGKGDWRTIQWQRLDLLSSQLHLTPYYGKSK